MKIIAITGGIASGKTTFCRILKNHGAYQLNSDEIIHQLISENKPCIDQIIDLLGIGIIENGKIDRGKIAKIVFSDDQKLKALEKILHPKLLERIKQEHKQANKGLYKFFVVEMPLIQEIGKESDFDFIVVVISDETVAQKRSFFSNNEYTQRMKRQWPITKKAKFADYVVMNTGSINDLNDQAIKLIKTLKL